MKPTFIIIFFSILFFPGCNSSKLTTGEVNFISHSEQGTILVSAAGYGPSKPAAVANAEINAFDNLIFRGIPGSQYHLPMIQNEREAKNQHADYFKNLLEGNGYKSFLMASEEQSGFSPARKNRKNMLVQIKINVTALRRDMEQHKIIRKLGL